MEFRRVVKVINALIVVATVAVVAAAFVVLPALNASAASGPATVKPGTFATIGASPNPTLTVPKPLQPIRVQYTEDAKRRGVKGLVVLQVTVDADGNVSDVHLLKGLPSGLTEAAVAAVRGSRFTPGTLAGRPVKSQVDLTFSFRLDQTP
jgi:TonB family protein